MVEVGGYTGRYLEVDLTSGKFQVKETPRAWMRNYVGGTGFAARYLWDHLSPGIDPLGPENVIVFATGPVTGTLGHATGRLAIASKAPLTGIWGESHVGGQLAPEIKYAGYDFIAITGRAEKPVYLWIDDDHVELRDASHLWGRGTRETFKLIWEDIGDESVQSAVIGPAGERLVRFANVIVDFYDAAGRTGMGAVMGSKKLKAIAVRGSKGIKVARFEEFWEVIQRIYEKATTGEWREIANDTIRGYGTPYLIDVMHSIGRLPTKNHWTGLFPEAEKINGDALKAVRISHKSCFTCFLQCKFVHHVDSGKYACTLTGGPEYEALVALGSNVMVSDLGAIIHANELCNDYGMDVISAGKVISWLMECYEKGLITEGDIGGIKPVWGDADLVIDLIHKMAKRKGIGDLLAEGALRAARKIGKGTERYVIHVKGLEASAQDGRSHKSIGLAHAVNVRGADHLRGLCTYDELPWAVKYAYERFGEEEAKKMVIDDRLNPTGKGYLTWLTENFYSIVDSMITCKYGAMWPMIYYYDDFAPWLKALTGIEELGDERKLALAGERIYMLRRAFNAREGVGRKEDTLNPRFTEEPMPEGPGKGQVVELEVMLKEYYEYRGLDWETGWPKRHKLVQLGLEDVAEELASMGRLAE